MHAPQAVDRMEILVLVDNVVDWLSTGPSYVETEATRLQKRGWKTTSGRCLCCGAHGLSCAITVWHGDTERTLLFDTGPEISVFERNVDRLGFDMSQVDGIVLSHGHWDHCGAMVRALEMIQLSGGTTPVPTYMHPLMYGLRAVKTADGSMRTMEQVPSRMMLEQFGASVIEATESQVILDDLFFVSGEIPRVTPFETGMPGQHRRNESGDGWELDELLMDERFVAVRVKDKGVIVFTACSHAGVVNVLTHARECFPGEPIFGVMGGFHLSGTNERIIPQTVEAMRPFELKTIAAAHCTGWRAVNALATAFGDAVAPASVGKTYRF